VYLSGKMRSDYHATIGVDFMTTTMDMGETQDTVKVQWWDTAGEERYRSVTRSYYRNSSAMVLVFDLSNPKTFDELEHWIDEIEEFRVKGQPILLIGNKLDLVNNTTKISTDVNVTNPNEKLVQITAYNDIHNHACKLAAEHDLIYIETSAKLNIRVKEAFDMLITQVYNNAMASHSPENWNVHDLDTTTRRTINYYIPKSNKETCCILM